MKFVVIESPFGGPDRERNIEYARACLKDSLDRGEAPFASHLLYTQVLDDDDPRQRDRGIRAGFEVAYNADLTAIYTDLGMTDGMHEGHNNALLEMRPIEYRSLGAPWSAS